MAYSVHNDNVNKKFMYILHKIILIILLLVLTMVLLKNYFLPQSIKALEITFKAQVSIFSERVLLVHNIWINDGKGQIVRLDKRTGLQQDVESKDSINKIYFYMSSNGWPYKIGGENIKGEGCANLWSYILRDKNNIVIKNMNILHNRYQTKCIYKIESVTAEYNYSDGTVELN